MTLLNFRFKQKHLLDISKILEFSYLKFFLTFVVSGIILIARRPEGIFKPQFFAEDGTIFFKGAYELAFYKSLFATYNGYYHFLPRLLAEIATLFPVKYAPLFYNTVSLLVASLCLSWIYLPHFRRLISKDWVRLTLVLFFLLFPNQEGLMKLSYLQWYLLLWIALCCLMELPKGTLSCFFLVLCSLIAFWTVAIGFMFIPIFIFAIIRSEDKRYRQVNLFLLFSAASAFLGNLLNLSTLRGNPSLEISLSTVIHGLLNAIIYKVICSAMFGSKITYWLFQQGWGFLYLSSFVFLLVVFSISLMVKKNFSVPVWILLYILFSSIACFMIACFTLRPYFLTAFLDGSELMLHDRYFFLATYVLCLFVSIVVLEFQNLFPPSAMKKIALSATITLFITMQLTSFHMPRWTIHNLHWNKYAELIKLKENEANTKQQTQTLLIPVNPRYWVIKLRIIPRTTNSVTHTKSNRTD